MITKISFLNTVGELTVLELPAYISEVRISITDDNKRKVLLTKAVELAYKHNDANDLEFFVIENKIKSY